MSNRWSVRIILALLLPVVLVATLVPATKMQQYLYGKWHQERAPYVTETVFKQDSTFTSITVQKGAA